MWHLNFRTRNEGIPAERGGKTGAWRRGLARGLVLFASLSGVALVLSLAGCTTACLSNRCDQDRPPIGLPPSIEKNPDPALIPHIPLSPDPVSVTDPDRPPRFLSLPEAFAMALEKGTVGLQSLGNPGLVSQDLVNFGGRGVAGSDAVRVLALAPAIAAAQMEGSLSRFDPIWTTGMTWRKVDQPTQGLSSFSNGAFANFTTTLAKPLATGGVAGVSFVTDYGLLSQPPGGAFSVLNPSYTTRVEIGVDQPLLRGYGTEINQVLPNLPSSGLFPSLNSRFASFTGEGILITRLRFDQQRADFERAIHFLILNVESAYWRLYGSYVDLYAAEQGLRQAHAAWTIGKAQVELGKIDLAQFALLRAQFEQFRASRMQALGQIITNERALRILLGLPVDDGTRLVPADAPNMTPYQPHWQAALGDCLTQRPELIIAREEVEVKHRQLQAQENSLLPDLRFQANYSAIGLGSRLDGPADTPSGTPGNALRDLSGNHFNNWTIGLNLNVPLGYRAQNAGVRQARLELGQAFQTLTDQERRAQNILAQQYSRVIETYKLIEIRRLAREALAQQLEVRFRKYAAGAKDSTLEFLLDAQRQWATAISQEYQSVVDYNIALASFEFCRGTILHYNKVIIAEGPLPRCAGVRAVEHEQERTQAVILRDRACPPLATLSDPISRALPALPTETAASVPALWSNTTPLPVHLDAPPTAPSLGLKGKETAPAPGMLPPLSAEVRGLEPVRPDLSGPGTIRPEVPHPAAAPARMTLPPSLPPVLPAVSPAVRPGASLGMPLPLEP